MRNGAAVSRVEPKLKRNPRFIEFVGLPGSGKTTLSHFAAEILRGQGTAVLEPTYTVNNEMRTVQRYLTKSWYCTRLSWLRPGSALQWFLLIVASRQKTFIDFVSMVINCFFILEIYRHHSRHKGICFLDQGICQAIVSLSYSSRMDNFIESRLFRPINIMSTLVFRIIHIETDVKTIVRRLEKRKQKQSRLERKKNSADFKEIIRSEERKIELLLTKLHCQLQADIDTIHRRPESIDSVAQQIADLFSDGQS